MNHEGLDGWREGVGCRDLVRRRIRSFARRTFVNAVGEILTAGLRNIYADVTSGYCPEEFTVKLISQTCCAEQGLRFTVRSIILITKRPLSWHVGKWAQDRATE